jgi:hypothetical protein
MAPREANHVRENFHLEIRFAEEKHVYLEATVVRPTGGLH